MGKRGGGGVWMNKGTGGRVEGGEVKSKKKKTTLGGRGSQGIRIVPEGGTIIDRSLHTHNRRIGGEMQKP